MWTAVRQPIAEPDKYFLREFTPYKESKKGNPQRWYPTRRNNTKPRVVVLHTAENRTDLHGEDKGAENVAKYFATGSRDVSIHACVDHDSIVMCLPDEACAWHVAGYNTVSLGVEMCMSSRDWVDVPDDYRQGMIYNCAKVVAHWCLKWDIPRKLITKQEVDAGASGIAYHATLDPKHRSDPGKGFPKLEFMEELRIQIARFSEKPAFSVAMGDDPRSPLLTPPAPPALSPHPPDSLKREFDRATSCGLTDGSRPNEPCTRAEAAVMAFRAAQL